MERVVLMKNKKNENRSVKTQPSRNTDQKEKKKESIEVKIEKRSKMDKKLNPSKSKEREYDVEENKKNGHHEEQEIEVIDTDKAKDLKIIELEAEVNKLKNEYFKAYADAENMKKRMQKDYEDRMKYRISSFAMEVLPVIDNLERALASSNAESEDAQESMIKGIEMIYNQLVNALSNEGVEVIEALHQPFNPNYHQALLSEAQDGVESNVIIEVLQKGYKLKDRMLRPSLVKVSE